MTTYAAAIAARLQRRAAPVIAILMALMLTAVLSAHLASWGMATFGLLGWYVATIGIAGASGATVVGLQLLVRRLRYVR